MTRHSGRAVVRNPNHERSNGAPSGLIAASGDRMNLQQKTGKITYIYITSYYIILYYIISYCIVLYHIYIYYQSLTRVSPEPYEKLQLKRLAGINRRVHPYTLYKSSWIEITHITMYDCLSIDP